MNAGDKVRFTGAYLNLIGADREIADMKGIVETIIPALKKPGGTIPARAKVLWNGDSEVSGCFLKYLEVTR